MNYILLVDKRNHLNVKYLHNISNILPSHNENFFLCMGQTSILLHHILTIFICVITIFNISIFHNSDNSLSWYIVYMFIRFFISKFRCFVSSLSKWSWKLIPIKVSSWVKLEVNLAFFIERGGTPPQGVQKQLIEKKNRKNNRETVGSLNRTKLPQCRTLYILLLVSWHRVLHPPLPSSVRALSSNTNHSVAQAGFSSSSSSSSSSISSSSSSPVASSGWSSSAPYVSFSSFFIRLPHCILHLHLLLILLLFPCFLHLWFQQVSRVTPFSPISTSSSSLADTNSNSFSTVADCCVTSFCSIKCTDETPAAIHIRLILSCRFLFFQSRSVKAAKGPSHSTAIILQSLLLRARTLRLLKFLSLSSLLFPHLLLFSLPLTLFFLPNPIRFSHLSSVCSSCSLCSSSRLVFFVFFTVFLRICCLCGWDSFSCSSSRSAYWFFSQLCSSFSACTSSSSCFSCYILFALFHCLLSLGRQFTTIDEASAPNTATCNAFTIGRVICSSCSFSCVHWMIAPTFNIPLFRLFLLLFSTDVDQNLCCRYWLVPRLLRVGFLFTLSFSFLLGAGIDSETLSNLFNPYSQSSASTARSFGGSGLDRCFSSLCFALSLYWSF